MAYARSENTVAAWRLAREVAAPFVGSEDETERTTANAIRLGLARARMALRDV